MRSLGLGLWLVCLASVIAPSARAQAPTSPDGGAPPAAPAPVDPNALTPPKLVTFVPAVYPEAAAAAGIAANVELEITIDATGVVSDVTVAVPAGQGFDEAAVAAAKQFVFEPAKKGATPIPSRIRYRYVFEMQPPPPPPEPPPAEVAPPAPEPAPIAPPAEEVVTDEEGFEARAVVDAPPREPTKRTIGKEELTRIAGTRGDALRTVELLPGVGRPPFGQGVLIVRGSSPDDTGVFFDGSPVPLLYHFGGLTSFMNSRLLERIEFYPGNFSAKYGRLMGGILEVNARDPASDGLHGVLDVNLLDASLLIEAPLAKNFSIALAARRSYIDFFFKEVVPKDAFDVVSAPIYWDYQLLATWRPTNKDRVRFALYGSSDQLELIFGTPPEGDPAIRGDFEARTSFHRGQISWKRALTPDVDQELMLSIGPNNTRFALGDAIRFSAVANQVYGRAEWTGRVAKSLTLRGGLDLFLSDFDATYAGPPPQQSEGNPSRGNPFASQPREEVEANAFAAQPAFYVEANVRPIEPLLLVAGLRADYFKEISSWSLDPRLSAILTVGPQTRVKGGFGAYSQPPQFQESSKLLGNPTLGPNRSVHGTIGVEQDVARGVTLGLEGYWKHLWDQVVGTQSGVLPRFENGGVGRIYGLEVSGRVNPGGRRWFGFLSYTFSRSERRDRGGQPWRLFDFDQTHILSLAGVYILGSGWEAGASFRLVSGNPQTPITGSYFLEDRGIYVPLYGAVNSDRASFFHRLDLRIEKKWSFESWKLALYLDVQNVYNYQTSEGRLYNYDFSESAVLPGLPVIPSIGLRGEL